MIQKVLHALFAARHTALGWKKSVGKLRAVRCGSSEPLAGYRWRRKRSGLAGILTGLNLRQKLSGQRRLPRETLSGNRIQRHELAVGIDAVLRSTRGLRRNRLSRELLALELLSLELLSGKLLARELLALELPLKLLPGDSRLLRVNKVVAHLERLVVSRL